MNDWALLATVVLGYASQWAKAHKETPTWIVQVSTFAIAFGFYAAGDHNVVSNSQWFRDGIVWAFSALGWGSLAGNTRLAPKTDSIGG